jgi:DNA-binding beta-propeller fold protein YncE
VDPSTNQVVAKTPVGRNPRFATAGAGPVWTLNEGDGTISRVDTKSGKLVASLLAGLCGHGGEITFGFGSVWATLDRMPITRIEAHSNSVTHRWRTEHSRGSRFHLATNLEAGLVWRISPDTL